MPVLLFPGQGSQKPGMGKDLYDAGGALARYFDDAEARVPGLLARMFDGPAEELSPTRYAQPALLTVSAALTHALTERGVAIDACAGHSLGEFSALHAAGALTWADALELVAERGRCMTEYVPEGAMAAVIGLEADAIEAALPEGVTVANYNGPQQTIISGTREGVASAEAALKDAGAKRVMPLAVSGPFHAPLMREAAGQFRAALDKAAVSAPRHRFVSSVSGQTESDPERIRALLAEQITAPVRWTDVMRTLGAVPALEAGPGKVLQGIARRMDGAPDVACAGTLEEVAAL